MKGGFAGAPPRRTPGSSWEGGCNGARSVVATVRQLGPGVRRGSGRGKGLLILPLLLAACGQAAQPTGDGSPGAALEAAAVRAGLVVDAKTASIVGSWGRDTDRLCVLPASDTTRIGALIDYGEGQGCAASGTVRRSGETLDVRFGGCRVTASFDGDRIVFPAEVPAACDSLCTGRASLAAMTVDRLSGSASEAATLRTPSGRALCDG